MNTQTRRQTSAFALAALFTLTMLAFANGLAVKPAVDMEMTAAAAKTQVVVVTGHRLARS